MSEFWESQDGETGRAYQAVTVYRDMGITRSLRRAADFYKGSPKRHQRDPKGVRSVGLGDCKYKECL